jgi:hypothetical protein
MKRPVTLIRVAGLLALCLLAAAPQAALACAGWVCMPVSFDPWCDACVYVGGEGSGGCAQSGPCSCFDVQCAATSPDEQKALPALGFVPEELQPAGACTDAPVAALVKS